MIIKLDSLAFGKVEGAAELAEDILQILGDKANPTPHRINRIRVLCNKAKRDYKEHLK